MELLLDRLPKEEQVTLALRSLFERRGYRRYQMSSFETYDMYLANKSFLRGGGIITFTDASGRLMALKPDVTMSIVKNTKEADAENKLYYIESVFRTAQHGSDIREINQMGIEYIGGADVYAEMETVQLAQQSLAAISEDYVLNISHAGFVMGLLDALSPEENTRAAMLSALQGKNASALRELAVACGAAQQEAQALGALAELSGPFAETLHAAEKLAVCEEMHAAITALQSLYDTLCTVEKQEAESHLRLDFSITGDVDYYNGLIMQGYVRGVPHAVLAGGRYDNLMRRFGKPQAALGFAVYLGELGRAFAARPETDVDVLLLYADSDAPATVAQTVNALQKVGKSVCAAQTPPRGLRAAQTLRLLKNGETEVVSC